MSIGLKILSVEVESVRNREHALQLLTQRVRHPWRYYLRHPLQFIKRTINSWLMD